MENQELNLYIMKRVHTENSLRSEEQKLDAVKSEQNREQNKYQAAKQTFQTTKLRLLSDKEPNLNPAAKMQKGEADTQKLKTDKHNLNDVHARLVQVEDKVKKQAGLVLQNKKKLEVLEERINMLRGKNAAKKNFKEELEVLDSKIQQMIIFNAKAKKAADTEFDKNKISEKRLYDEGSQIESADELAVDLTVDRSLLLQTFDQVMQNSDSSTFSGNAQQQHSNHQQHSHYQQQPQHQQQNEQVANTSNQDFHDQIENLSHFKDGDVDRLNLRFFNKLGHGFELEIIKQPDNGLLVEIKPHSKLDTISLNSGKYEIIKSLKDKGFKLTNVIVKEYNHVPE